LAPQLEACAGFAEALAELAAGRPASFDGVWGSACALVAAAFSQGNHGPLVVICPTAREADDLAADLELFTEREAILFPSWETSPDERLAHDETFGERLRVLKGLLKPAAPTSLTVPQEPQPTPRGLGGFLKSRRAEPEAEDNALAVPGTPQRAFPTEI